MGSAQDRQLARLLRLVPLLLSGAASRSTLPQALGAALSESGWDWALPREDGDDPVSLLDRDVSRLKRLVLLRFGPGRKRYEATLGDQASLWVSVEEAQALRLAQAVLEQLGLPEAMLLQGLWGRVDGALRGRAGALPTVSPSLRGLNPLHWAALQEGLEGGRRMRLAYRKPGRESVQEVQVDRARLMWMTGTFYLVAYVPGSENREDGEAYGHLREYHLNRIEEVEVLKARVRLAQLPLLEGEALLSAEVGGRVPDLFDALGEWVQKAEVEDDGRVRLWFRDPGILRAKQRLLPFGEHLEAVLHPPKLARALGPHLALNAQLRAQKEMP